MTESINNSFLCLIRLGIDHPVTILPNSIDWETMRGLAAEQGLSAIVLDGAQKLTESGKLTEGRAMDVTLKKEWKESVIQDYERKYEDYCKQNGELARFYSEHGYKMMVLKGFGLSLNYPIPSHRLCRKIDIWMFGKHKEADKALSQELKIPIDSKHHHHTTFMFGDYPVENHYDFLNIRYGKGNDVLERVFNELAMDDSVKTEVDGQTIYLPTANLHALFVLMHTMSHFASTGMNLRQVLDWGFLIEKHGGDIDWPWFMHILDDCHMTEFFHYLNAVCVDDLGFEVSVFPPFQFNVALKERVLNDILSPEFPQEAPSGVWKRIPFKYRRWLANDWKQNLCYGKCRFKSFWIDVFGRSVPSID